MGWDGMDGLGLDLDHPHTVDLWTSRLDECCERLPLVRAQTATTRSDLTSCLFGVSTQ